MSSLDELVFKIAGAKQAALMLGAGISFSIGIPGGYRLPLEFAEKHLDLISALGLDQAMQQAVKSDDWRTHEDFVRRLIAAFRVDVVLQKALSRWLADYPHFAGPMADDHPIDEAFSDEHAIFVLAWLQDLFAHMITTNWDFLLEWQVTALHDQVYSGELFEMLSVRLKSGGVYPLDPHQLFFLEPLDGDDLAWNSRWDIISHANDLADVHAWSRVIWKIHGSPFLLACPKCGAQSRWKLSEPLEVGDPCPIHPDTSLVPEIVFWGEGIDTAHPLIWAEVRSRLQASDLIVVCGLSGSGSDAYIREVIENHDDAWIVSPNAGSWDLERVKFVSANAAELTSGLLPLLR